MPISCTSCRGGNSRKATALQFKAYAALSPRTNIQLQASASKASSSFTAHSWVAADLLEDALATWSSGTPTRITVPSGYTKARITLAPSWAYNSTSGRQCYVLPNGSGSAIITEDARPALAEGASGTISPWLMGLVGGTTYFEVFFAQTSGGALNLTGGAGLVTATKVMFEWAQ